MLYNSLNVTPLVKGQTDNKSYLMTIAAFPILYNSFNVISLVKSQTDNNTQIITLSKTILRELYCNQKNVFGLFLSTIYYPF